MTKVLCVSYSPIYRDPRVLRQISWLQKLGIEVDVLGLGTKPDGHTGKFFEISQVSIFKRILIYIFASNNYRYKRLIRDQVPKAISDAISLGEYEVIQINDLDFLPWVIDLQEIASENLSKTRWALDLHEFFPGVKGGVVWRIITERFHNWLLTQLKGFTFNTYSTVSSEIARAYHDALGIEIENIVWNAPRFSQRNFEARTKESIALVYHGNTGKGRPLRLYIKALKGIGPNFTLHIMIRSSALYKYFLMVCASIYGVRHRTYWHETVPVEKIGDEISKFDIELAWFPPVSENMHLSLGNKFFEAVQGNLGLIVGQSPSMVSLVDKFEIGKVTKGWKLSDLEDTLMSISRFEVEEMRRKSFKNSFLLSADTSEKVFISKVINV